MHEIYLASPGPVLSRSVYEFHLVLVAVFSRLLSWRFRRQPASSKRGVLKTSMVSYRPRHSGSAGPAICSCAACFEIRGNVGIQLATHAVLAGIERRVGVVEDNATAERCLLRTGQVAAVIPDADGLCLRVVAVPAPDGLPLMKRL